MKRGTPEHPKVDDLREILRCSKATAVGYLELLWHFTAKFAPQGDIGRYSDKRIEGALDWSGRGGILIGALVDSKWIDRHSKWRLLVHDWRDHADDSVRKRLSRGGLQFVEVTDEVTGQCPDTDRKVSATQPDKNCLPLPEPVPEPEPNTEEPPKPPICASADARDGVPQLALIPFPQQPSPPSNGTIAAFQRRWFDQWWEIYWRKVSRKAAEKAFQAHVKSLLTFEAIMAATKCQTPAMMAREPDHRPHGATWLNGERWKDEASKPSMGVSNNSRKPGFMENVERVIGESFATKGKPW